MHKVDFSCAMLYLVMVSVFKFSNSVYAETTISRQSVRFDGISRAPGQSASPTCPEFGFQPLGNPSVSALQIKEDSCPFYVNQTYLDLRRIQIRVDGVSANLSSRTLYLAVFDLDVSSTVPVFEIGEGAREFSYVAAGFKGLVIVPNRISPSSNGSAVVELKLVDTDNQCSTNNPCDTMTTCYQIAGSGTRCSPCPVGFVGSDGLKCTPVRPCSHRTRTSLRTLLKDDAETKRLIDAFNTIYRDGRYEEFIWLHNEYTVNYQYAHQRSGFLPWHRYYLLLLEDLLRSATPESYCVTLPYWNWMSDKDHLPGVDIFNEALLGRLPPRGTHACIQGGFFGNWTSITGTCMNMAPANTSSLPSEKTLLSALEAPVYGNDTFGFRFELEYLHNLVHVSLSGIMTTPYAANFPPFFMHHAMVDLLWDVWQGLHNIDRAELAYSESRFVDGKIYPSSAGLNLSLDSEMPFNFLSERLRLRTQDAMLGKSVSPRDLITSKKIGVTFLADEYFVNFIKKYPSAGPAFLNGAIMQDLTPQPFQNKNIQTSQSIKAPTMQPLQNITAPTNQDRQRFCAMYLELQAKYNATGILDKELTNSLQALWDSSIDRSGKLAVGEWNQENCPNLQQ